MMGARRKNRAARALGVGLASGWTGIVGSAGQGTGAGAAVTNAAIQNMWRHGRHAANAVHGVLLLVRATAGNREPGEKSTSSYWRTR